MRRSSILLIGPPGSGKGTQGVRLAAGLGVPVISTGEILRAAVRSGTPLGLAVEATMASGALVGDDVMVELVRGRLAEPDAAKGYILDGFPRTAAQAQALDAMRLDAPILAIVLDVPDAELQRRLESRRICVGCKRLYAAGTDYGSEPELCSRCGAMLIKRSDDRPEVIKARLATYHDTAAPLIDHYRARNALVVIDGARPQTTVENDLLAAVGLS